jgi:hypothetical protein
MPDPELVRDTSLEDGKQAIGNVESVPRKNATTQEQLAPTFGQAEQKTFLPAENSLPDSIVLNFNETIGDVLCAFPDSSYNDWLKANPSIDLKKSNLPTF